MAHEDLGDTTRHIRTCNWWTGAPGTEGAAYEREMKGELRYRDCTCSLRWREMVRTEREMHAAWRKRAEEAEALMPVSRALRDDLALGEGNGSVERVVANISKAIWNKFCVIIGDRA